jgi:hypothetical protein
MARALRWRRGSLLSSLAFLMVAVATVAGLTAAPATTATPPVADQVIVAGAVGLRWDDVDPEQTPHLWRLAETGSIGSLSVRSAQQPTCPADGWVTLGAGNWASGTFQHPGAEAETEPPSTEPCPPLAATLESADSGSAYLPEQEDLVRHNQWELPWGAVPGALAGSVGCTVAVGEGAAVAAARSYGRVDRYQPSVPVSPAATARLLGERCELAIVDLGTVSGTGEQRAAAARRMDATLGRVLAGRPSGGLVMVAGVADLDGAPHLHVAVADAPGLAPGWLTSASTGRTGYLQLVDIAPTVLAALDREPPELLFSGHPVDSRPSRPADLAAAVDELVSADQQAQRARPVSTWFLAGLTVAELLLFAGVVPLLRRPPAGPSQGSVNGAGATGRRPGGGGAPRSGAGGALGGGGAPRSGAGGALLARQAVPMLLVAAALAIPVALAVGGVPWWRVEAAVAGGAFAVTSLGVLALASLLVVRTPLFRRTLGLVGAGAGLAAAAVAVDLLTGSWLQLNGVVGYLAHDGGRYAGLSPIGLGVLIAGTLLVAGCLAEQVPRRRRPLVIAAVGALGVVLAGSPYLGAETGGAVALAAGVCVAVALSTGRWVTARRVAWPAAGGLAVLVAVAVFDLQRPAEQRSGLGTTLGQLAEGTAGIAVRRVSLANVEVFVSSPLTVLAIVAGAFIWFALLRPWGGLRRLFGIHPALRAALVGGAVAGLVGGILVGAALAVAGAAAAVGVPLLTLAALRLRERSAQRAARVVTRLAPMERSQVLE